MTQKSMQNFKSIDTETGLEAAPEVSSERVHDIFSNIATKYERFNAISSMGTYKSWVKKMMDLADISGDDEVLDIAGGTGEISFAVANSKKPKRIVCSDLVSEMLDVAKAHYTKDGANDVDIDFTVVDAQDIPFGDTTFDAVTMAYGLRNMPNRELALSEMYRVMKPGASLTCLDFSTPENPLLRGLYHIYLRYMIPFWGKVITGDSSGFVYLAKSIKAFPDQEGVKKMMEDVGFERVEWKNCMGGIACIHTARKPVDIKAG